MQQPGAEVGELGDLGRRYFVRQLQFFNCSVNQVETLSILKSKQFLERAGILARQHVENEAANRPHVGLFRVLAKLVHLGSTPLLYSCDSLNLFRLSQIPRDVKVNQLQCQLCAVIALYFRHDEVIWTQVAVCHFRDVTLVHGLK